MSNRTLTGWAADSRQLYFVEFKGTHVVLYAMPVDGPPRAVFVPKGTVGMGIATERPRNLRGPGVAIDFRTGGSLHHGPAFDEAGAGERGQHQACQNCRWVKLR